MSALVAIEPQQEQTFFSVITEQEQKSITNEIICGKKLKFIRPLATYPNVKSSIARLALTTKYLFGAAQFKTG